MHDVNAITEAGGRCLPVLGGCICCSLADSFVAAMLQITAVRDSYDHILIEACAAADPVKVMEFAHADSELAARRIILTCIDEKNLPPFSEYADRIIPQSMRFDPRELIA